MGSNDDNLGLFLKHRHEMVDYATKIVGDRGRGEDIVQEAFIRMRSVADAQRLEEPLGYLRRIIRNLAIDLLRRSTTEARRFASDAASETVAEDRPGQDRIVEAKDDLRVVMQAMAELPERTRRALEMHRFEGAKLKEIATALDISIASAHGLVYEGLEHCRKRLVRQRGP